MTLVKSVDPEIICEKDGIECAYLFSGECMKFCPSFRRQASSFLAQKKAMKEYEKHLIAELPVRNYVKVVMRRPETPQRFCTICERKFDNKTLALVHVAEYHHLLDDLVARAKVGRGKGGRFMRNKQSEAISQLYESLGDTEAVALLVDSNVVAVRDLIGRHFKALCLKRQSCVYADMLKEVENV